jgi:hypothetical protein
MGVGEVDPEGSTARVAAGCRTPTNPSCWLTPMVSRGVHRIYDAATPDFRRLQLLDGEGNVLDNRIVLDSVVRVEAR